MVKAYGQGHAWHLSLWGSHPPLCVALRDYFNTSPPPPPTFRAALPLSTGAGPGRLVGSELDISPSPRADSGQRPEGHGCGPSRGLLPDLWRSLSEVGRGETEAELGSGSGAQVTGCDVWAGTARATATSGEHDWASVPPAPETLVSACQPPQWTETRGGSWPGGRGWLRSDRPRLPGPHSSWEGGAARPQGG